MLNELTDLELDALVIRVGNSSAKQLQRDLYNNVFNERQKPYIEAFVVHKIKEERNEPIKLYHRRKASDGETFKAHETFALMRDGWVDSPSKFEKDTRDKIADVSKTVFAFCRKEYKWIVGTILFIIYLYLKG